MSYLKNFNNSYQTNQRISEEDLTQIQSHFEMNYSNRLLTFINDSFKERNYYFIEKRNKEYFGYCTSCKFESIEPSIKELKQNSKYNCPHCNLETTLIHARYGRKYLIDEGYFVTYAKSQLDPNLLVARTIRVFRDFRGDYKATENKFADESYLIFGKNETHIMRYVYFDSAIKDCNVTPFLKKASLFANARTVGTVVKNDVTMTFDKVLTVIDTESVSTATKGTPLAYCGWEQYLNLNQGTVSYYFNAYHYSFNDLIHYFKCALKYPTFEYLLKFGMDKFVFNKVDNVSLDFKPKINYKASTIEKVLCIDRQTYSLIKKAKAELNYSLLELVQLLQKSNPSISIETILKYEYIFSCGRHSLVGKEQITNFVPLLSALKYLHHQRKNQNNSEHTMSMLVTSYKDYLKECLILKKDLTSDKILYPIDVIKAHDENRKQLKYLRDIELDKKIKALLPALKKYTYKTDKYVVRAFKSSKEIIQEGAELRHCVGGYVDDHAKGRTILLAIRKISEINKPFYTMEIHPDGTLLQVQTYDHKTPVFNNNHEVSQLIQDYLLFINSAKKKPLKKIA